MTYHVAKEKLHSYIEHANHDKVMAIYTLLEAEIENKAFDYNEEELQLFEKISREAFAGISKTASAEESMKGLRKHRKGNAL
jgi:hypothetical protein